MKLRIQGDSVRFRLTQSEVDQLLELGQIDSEINFPDGNKLSYALKSSGEFHCSFDNDQVALSVPADAVNAWAKSDQVGISHRLKVPDDKILLILVEKDFKCLTRSADEEGDMFPNPKTSHELN